MLNSYIIISSQIRKVMMKDKNYLYLYFIGIKKIYIRPENLLDINIISVFESLQVLR